MSVSKAWAAALAVSVALAAGAARATDDGDGPIWEGIGTSFGLVKRPNDDLTIDYHERARLVLPKTTALPKPGTAAETNPPSWPKDPDVLASKKALLDQHKPTFQGFGSGHHEPAAVMNAYAHTAEPTGPITIGANAGQGAGIEACNTKSGIGACPGVVQDPGANAFSKMFSNFNTVTLAAEPERQYLTDPPLGYRAPIVPAKATPTPTPAAKN